MRLSRIFIVALLVALVAEAGQPIAAADISDTTGSGAVPLRVGVGGWLGDGLIYVAKEQGFFWANGLDVTLISNITGAQSLEQLVNDRLDVALVKDLPLVYLTLDPGGFDVDSDHGIAVVADLVSSGSLQGGVGLADRGVSSHSDLAGHRVGFPHGTSIDYLLDVILRTSSIPLEAVEMVDIPANRLAEALEEGQVDAVYGWEPHLTQARLRVGAAAVPLGTGMVYANNWMVAFMRHATESRPGTVRAFLRALLEAERYSDAHPTETQSVIARHLGIEPVDVATQLERISLSVTLSETLHVTLLQQGEWAMRTGRVPRGALSAIPALFSPEALADLAPARVTLIR